MLTLSKITRSVLRGPNLLGSLFLLAVVSASLIPALGEGSISPRQEEQVESDPEEVIAAAAALAHEQVFLESRFPSATACGKCHPLHYKEWSVSQHAYAMVSPVFTALQGTILKRTNGTNGDFCIRCHTQVGMIMGESVFMPYEDRSHVSQEGITCIVCHRIDQEYGKVSGRIALVEGDMLEPIYGPLGNEILSEVLADPDKYRVVTEAGVPGRKIHGEAKPFFRQSEPGFCGICHDVTLGDGFRLEELFTQYKRSPAADKGITCQDCHMSKNQGVNAGYDMAPGAVVGGVPTKLRKHAVHNWAGPDHSVVHPGLFPHNPEAKEMATVSEWIQFDVDAGWGTDKFEDEEHDEESFPNRWRFIDDRYDARDVVSANQELLAWAFEERRNVLKNGYALGEIVTERVDAGGIEFKVQVKSTTEGHAAPSGFDAERLVWLHIVVADRNGKTVFESGDFDPNFDLRNIHSEFVHDGLLPQDKQLFNLQAKFITRNVRGGDREQVIPVNYSADPLPFVRPSTRSTVLLGRTANARKHKRGIEPLGSRWAPYTIRGKELTGAGPYTATIDLMAGMAPANLIRDIQEVGFDLNMSPLQIVKGVGKGYIVLHTDSVQFDLDAASAGTHDESSD